MHEIHDRKNELRTSTQLLTAIRKFEGREPFLEESTRKNCAHPIISRYGNKEAFLCQQSPQPSQWIFVQKRLIPTNERKWIVADANLLHGGAFCRQVSNMVTKMVRHHDRDERELDGLHHCDTVKAVLLMAFARYGAQKFPEGHLIRLIHEGSSMKRIEYCVDHKNPLS